MPAMVPGRRIRKTPPDSAALHSPLLMPPAAKWVDTREEEQAVWVLTQGPVSPKE